ncbi:glycosyltransferase family 2 protein [Umezawaea tangerina]|uniref:Glycosyl transferase family 2 n=1 Tax=Umezawaea tangerina TaxID=84725 RepID=A0A2T0TGL3_9PSEU|nr:glycosyltransferase [Umezawaea tangerina]PRY44827.1 glycosyl transferase family 2 [Umezawaea tangerina]
MPTISIITAAYAPKSDFLPATADGVRAQVLPAGWDVEWVVQEDGADPSLEAFFHDVPNARYGANGVQLGISATRNLALTRARGRLVQVLDHDDVLLPGALATLLAAFERHEIHWAVGAADDLLPDGTRKAWDSALPFGLVKAGEANAWAEAHGGNWPVHCAGLLVRTDSLRAVGGWASSPVDDDLVAFAALSELGDGWNEQAVTWLYRQHAGQTTRSDALVGLRDAGRLMALQRVKALRGAGMVFAPAAPLGFDGRSHDVNLLGNIKPPASLG